MSSASSTAPWVRTAARRSLAVAGALLIVLAAAPAGAFPDAPAGHYAVTGRARLGGPYEGEAEIRAEAAGLVLQVVRAGEALSGALAEDGSGYRFEAALSRGILGALGGEPVQGAVFRAVYRPAEGGRLDGTWQILRGREVLDEGTECLVPRRTDEPGDGARDATPPEPTGRVRVAVSVDWEGSDLEPENLDAMERFHAELPDVPLTHFLNAAYFTKTGADPARVAASIRRGLAAGDETGLHVHGWRSLMVAAGVRFRTHPTFWGDRYPLQPEGSDLGHEVELAAYETDELRAVVSRSRAILADAGFPLSASFRAGGWIAPPHVLHAVRAEGFLVDSSATDMRWHDELAGYALRGRIGEVWPDVTEDSAPFFIETPAGAILEMPDTGALADYVTADEMASHLRRAIARLRADPGRDVFRHIGFHQETAARYARRVAEAIRRIRAESPDAPIVFETLEPSAAAAREALGAPATAGAAR